MSRAIEQWTPTYCPYCGVGCGLLVGTRENDIVKVKGDPNHPSNYGDICAKAVYLNKVVRTHDRLLYPQVQPRRAGLFRRVGWEKALEAIASKFQEIIAYHGPSAVAFYGSGQLLTEDYYVANKLVKGFLGTNNFDANSRLCMASAVAGYKTSLGSDGPPAAYADLELADLFFIIGANMAACHPILFRRIQHHKRKNPERVKIIVVDPRRTETARAADLYVPIQPGTDIVFLNAILHTLIKENLENKAFIANHTKNWGDTQEIVKAYTPEHAQAICGIPSDDIIAIARQLAQSDGVISLWSMGVNQSTEGVHKNNAIINLHLATGQIGKPGAGPFSLTGQPNAMGGREAGGLSHLLPGYRSVSDATHREEIARLWGVPPASLSSRPGYTAVELFEAAAAGKVKALWIIATNPVVSMPEVDLVERALRKAELVIVQDAYHPTDTSQFADFLLPAAQWPEKEGTMTNSERRITYLPKILEPQGEALPDWKIFALFAEALGWANAFPYETAEEIFEEFKRATQGRIMDITGVTYPRLKQGPVQWPCPSEDHPGTERLYTDKSFSTCDGKATFVPTDYRGPCELPDSTYPMILTTGRVKNHWHTMTRTGKVDWLNKADPEPFIEINPADTLRLGIQDGDFVEVTGKLGKVIVQTRVTDNIKVGTCFMPFHWGRMSGFYKAANNLTTKAFDPVSKQPELKFSAVSVKKIMTAEWMD